MVRVSTIGGRTMRDTEIGKLEDGSSDPCYDCTNIDKACGHCGESVAYDRYVSPEA